MKKNEKKKISDFCKIILKTLLAEIQKCLREKKRDVVKELLVKYITEHLQSEN